MPIRSLNMYGQETLGPVTIAGPGYGSSDWRPNPGDAGSYGKSFGQEAGLLRYDSLKGGYGTLAVAGAEYNLTFSPGDVPRGGGENDRRAVFYSNRRFDRFGRTGVEAITLNVASDAAKGGGAGGAGGAEACTLASNHSVGATQYTGKFRRPTGEYRVGDCTSVFDWTGGWVAAYPAGTVPALRGRLIADKGWLNGRPAPAACQTVCASTAGCNYVLAQGTRCMLYAKCVSPGNTTSTTDGAAGWVAYYRPAQACISDKEDAPPSAQRVLKACDDAGNGNDDGEAASLVTRNSTTHVIQFDLNVGAAASVSVKRGDTVRWEWGTLAHDVRSGLEWSLDHKFGCTPSLGGSYSHTFAFDGVYPYLCTLHPKSMAGTITVGSPAIRACKAADYAHLRGRCRSGDAGCVRDDHGRKLATAGCAGGQAGFGNLVMSGGCLDKCVFGSTKQGFIGGKNGAGSSDSGSITQVVDSTNVVRDPCWEYSQTGYSATPETRGRLVSEHTHNTTEAGTVFTGAQCEVQCMAEPSCKLAVFSPWSCKLYAGDPDAGGFIYRGPSEGQDAASGYAGCYMNTGGTRINGHAPGPHTIDDCRARATQEGKPYFGMEWPQGFQPNYAQCVTLAGKPPAASLLQTNTDCEAEFDASGRRLSSGNRLAVYAAALPAPTTASPYAKVGPPQLVRDLALPSAAIATWAPETCRNWKQAYGATGLRLRGEVLGSYTANFAGEHGNASLPNDGFCAHCYDRCFLQQANDCLAVSYAHDTRKCTYFKTVSGITRAKGGYQGTVVYFRMVLQDKCTSCSSKQPVGLTLTMQLSNKTSCARTTTITSTTTKTTTIPEQASTQSTNRASTPAPPPPTDTCACKGPNTRWRRELAP